VKNTVTNHRHRDPSSIMYYVTAQLTVYHGEQRHWEQIYQSSFKELQYQLWRL